jgi:DUF4097 and DUF4098 domain-containing protein YvlB
MRRRSLAGPLLLLIVGGLFLWNNLHPELPIFDLLAQYWPFLLIGWGVVRLLEVLAWRPERGGTFTGGEIALVVLICIAGMGVYEAHRHGVRFNGHGLDMFGQQYEFPVSARGPAGGARRVVFENPRGNVRVTGGDTQEVVVSGHKLIRAYNQSDADRTNQNTPVEIVTQGDRILIRTNQDRTPSNQRVSDDLEVTVPRSVTVEARGNSGDYDVSEIAGDVELTGDRGDARLGRIGGKARVQIGRSDLVRAVDVKGNLEVQGRGSDIELENIAGQVTINGAYSGTLEFKNLARPLQFESRNTELRVEALPGRLSMDLGELKANNLVGPVRLVTHSRDIKIEDFTHSLELETERGDIELQPGRLPLAKIEARSKTGRIDLVLPEKASFQLDATAEHGDAVNDYGPSIQREVEGRTATLKGKVGNGPTIHLTTDRGSVAVRRAGAGPSRTVEAPENPVPPMPPVSPAPGAPKPPARSLADSEVKL